LIVEKVNSEVSPARQQGFPVNRADTDRGRSGLQRAVSGVPLSKILLDQIGK
jgi:hypothetical protein